MNKVVREIRVTIANKAVFFYTVVMLVFKLFIVIFVVASYVRRKITRAIKEFEKKTCLRFKRVSMYSREHYIKFFRGRG